MEDVLDVYQRPYAPTRPVVCLDEASKELHDLPRGSLPVEQGQPRRQDYEYERHGVANLFLMIEPLRGWRKVRVTERRTRCDFAEQLRLLSDEDYPQAERIVLVVDNLNTHGPGSLYEAFEPEEARLARLMIATSLANMRMQTLAVFAKEQNWDRQIHSSDRCDLSQFSNWHQSVVIRPSAKVNVIMAAFASQQTDVPLCKRTNGFF
jgi:hypothetical protein